MFDILPELLSFPGQATMIEWVYQMNGSNNSETCTGKNTGKKSAKMLHMSRPQNWCVCLIAFTHL
jgi:hypothetical protein